MQTKTKRFYKKSQFWELAILFMIVAALVVFLALQNTTDPILADNPYEPTDFTEVNGYLTDFSGESVLGIDVSQFQGDIDWQQVADFGVEFAMIRIGGRGTAQEGSLYFDDNFEKNYQGATEAGIQVGGYFFSQATTPEEAQEEAEYALERMAGRDFQMPIVFDWEYMDDARTSGVSAQEIMAFAKTFNDRMAAAGYTPMVYFNRRMIANGFDLEQMADYHFWLAMYDTEMDFPYRVDMWQYTATGRVPGISGNVDLNLYFPRKEGE